MKCTSGDTGRALQLDQQYQILVFDPGFDRIRHRGFHQSQRPEFYTTPTATANGDSAVPTSSGSPWPDLFQQLLQYIRLQLHTVASGATPGDGGSNIFSLSWDES